MPRKPPQYDLPDFNPDGSTDLAAAMSDWVTQFAESYKAGQEESERLPYIVSTFSNESTNNPKAGYITKTIQLMGGEQVQVFGFFDFTISVGGVLTTNSGNIGTETARGKLRITYPGGSTASFGSQQEARLRLTLAGQGTSEGTVQRTTITQSMTASFVWPIEAKMQTGGTHTFQLGTSGSGTISGGQMTILVV